MTLAIGRFQIGQKVRWTYASSWFEGVVTAIVPEGVIPNLTRMPAKARSHVSYVVTARRLNSRAQQYGSVCKMWPKPELLRRI